MGLVSESDMVKLARQIIMEGMTATEDWDELLTTRVALAKWVLSQIWVPDEML